LPATSPSSPYPSTDRNRRCRRRRPALVLDHQPNPPSPVTSLGARTAVAFIRRTRRCRRIRPTSTRSDRASSPSARSLLRGRGSGARSFPRGRYSVSLLRSPPGCAA
jgi:hypothetical protein